MRPKVLHVITALDLGGAQQNTLHTVRTLDRSRFDARLLCGRGGILDDEAARTMPVTFCDSLVHPIRPSRDLRAFFRIRDEITRLRSAPEAPVVVHTHCTKAGVLGRLAARSARADVVVHTLHGFGFHPVLAPQGFERVERLLRGRADALIFVSQRDMDRAERLGLLASCRGYLVRSGIDLRAYRGARAGREAVRNELMIPADAPVVVTVANFKAQKNPGVALRAFAAIAARDPRAHWVFAGGGDDRAFVAELRRAGLVERAHFLGWRRDVARILGAGDVFMLSSDAEGLPRSAVEALAAGLPVVATRAGGIDEIVDDRVGVLVPLGDAEGLARGVARMFASRPDIERCAADSLRAFDIDGMVRQQEAIYEELLSVERGASPLDRRSTSRHARSEEMAVHS